MVLTKLKRVKQKKKDNDFNIIESNLKFSVILLSFILSFIISFFVIFVISRCFSDLAYIACLVACLLLLLDDSGTRRELIFIFIRTLFENYNSVVFLIRFISSSPFRSVSTPILCSFQFFFSFFFS